MINLLSSAATWLAGQRKNSLATPVTYKRGTSTASIAATIGSRTFESQDSNGVRTTIQSRDFIVDREDLVLMIGLVETPIVPQPGDQVLQSVYGKTEIYEVLPTRIGPAFTYSDNEKKTIRIHTKFVGTQA